MFFLIYIGLASIVYIATFKNDFSKEHIEKAGTFIIIVSAILIIMGMLGSIATGG